MKPVLVLGPQPAGTPPLEHLRLEVHRTALTRPVVAQDAAYSAVLVIDDTSVATVQRLLLALRLCRRRQTRVGVLTYFDEAELRKIVACAPPAEVAGDLPLHDLLRREPRLRVGLGHGRLNVEYQAD